MKIKTYCFLLVLILFIFTSCKSINTVDFKTPVDTSSKYIKTQQNRIYVLPEVGVYASNEFDAARLNGFKLENDSTAVVIINPENAPIPPQKYTPR